MTFPSELQSFESFHGPRQKNLVISKKLAGAITKINAINVPPDYQAKPKNSKTDSHPGEKVVVVVNVNAVTWQGLDIIE